jgi:arabinogalactan oligomer/maltooligosaccharide transport system substrate-binding protein
LIARLATAQRLVAYVAILLMLAACTTATTPASAPGSTVQAAAPAAVTLVLWHGWANAPRQALSRLVDQFNQRHPAGRISLQSVPLASFESDLRSALAPGGGPHVMLLPNSWIGSLSQTDALLALDDLIAPADQKPLLPAAIGGARAAGADGKPHLYGLPISFDTLALFYNTSNVLTPPADTAALLQNARGLAAPNATQPVWGLALNLSLDTTIGYLYAAGGRVFDDQGKVALGGAGRAGAEQWLGWLKQLQDDRQLLARADNSIQVDRELKGGRVLMTFDWAHQLSLYRSLWGERLGVAPLPRLTATNQSPQPYVKSEVLVINSRVSASERATALDFLRYMISANAQLELLRSDIQPVRSDLKLDASGLDATQVAAAQAFRTAAQQGQPMPNTPTRERDIIRRELTQMQRQVLRGDATPADAVSEADKRLRDQLGNGQP